MLSLSEGAKIYLNKLRSHHDAFKESLASLHQAMPQNDQDEKVKMAVHLRKEAVGLRDQLPHDSYPNWLIIFIRALSSFINDPQEKSRLKELYNTLRTQTESALNHNWVEVADDTYVIDLDGLFERYRRESRIPELLHEIMDTLDLIIDSGKVDSITIMNHLRRARAAVLRSQKGSYLELIGSTHMVKIFVKHTLIELAKEIPGLRALISAVEKGVDELNSELSQVNTMLETAIGDQLGNLEQLREGASESLLTMGDDQKL